jgi:predicted DNA-binding protein (MmcQ/YjbR family)
VPPSRRSRAQEALRRAALAYPEAEEDFPWGHRVVKVRRKIFVALNEDEPGLRVSVKLPWSAEGALQFPFCEPTGYGLGRAGWVTATFGPREPPPVEMLRSWIDESYRAVAPKKLVATLAPPPAAGDATKAPRRARRARRGR